MLENCEQICHLVDQIKGLKARIRKELSSWFSMENKLSTEKLSQPQQHAVVLCLGSIPFSVPIFTASADTIQMEGGYEVMPASSF